MIVRISTAALAMAFAGFSAEAYAQTFEIDNAVARVIYRVEDRSDIEVSVQEHRASGLPALQVRREGHNVFVDGGLTGRNRISNCRTPSEAAAPTSPGQDASVNVRGVGRIELADAPLVIVRGPRNATVRAYGGVYGTVASGADNVDIASAGCGAWVVGNATNKVRVSVGGSGNVWTGSSNNMELNIGGSGNIRATKVNDLRINIGGSGNIRIGDAAGNVDVRVGGSGNVEVASADIGLLKARVAGSGSIDIAGTVRDLDASIMGAGHIEVDRVTGSVNRRIVGAGTIRVRQQ